MDPQLHKALQATSPRIAASTCGPTCFPRPRRCTEDREFAWSARVDVPANARSRTEHAQGRHRLPQRLLDAALGVCPGPKSITRQPQ
eukprot:3015082-Pyramimonas_sp.AAC.1